MLHMTFRYAFVPLPLINIASWNILILIHKITFCMFCFWYLESSIFNLESSVQTQRVSFTLVSE